MTRKIRYERVIVASHRVMETRSFKTFNNNHFLDDLAQQPWDKFNLELNPEAMWNVWKNLFMDIVDKRAPLKRKRVSKKHSPWITYDFTRKIHKLNYLKRTATLENDVTIWQQYKHTRNETNNAIRQAKRQYFMHNLEIN